MPDFPMLHTLDDLHEAAGAKLAVIGQPVGHSLSPRMHQPALDEAGVDARYVALEVGPGRVKEAFTRMRELGFIGCNVTVPHKFDALEACDEIDDTARELGAVNTVRFDQDATRGTNTDGYGFEHAVKETLGLKLPGLSVLIVGAGGGAGGAIAAHCARRGVSRLILVNRTLPKVEELVRKLRSEHPRVDLTALGTDDTAVLPALAAGCTLLVNTTSLGLKEGDPSPLPAGCIHENHCVFDTIYRPTALIRAAQAAGARHANGNLMLLHQGIAAFRFWFPGTDPDASMRRGLGL